MKLKKINIQNFRKLTNIAVDGLKDINFFIGRNNVGKTSIFDAIWTVCSAAEDGYVNLNYLEIGKLNMKEVFNENTRIGLEFDNNNIVQLMRDKDKNKIFIIQDFNSGKNEPEIIYLNNSVLYSGIQSVKFRIEKKLTDKEKEICINKINEIFELKLDVNCFDNIYSRTNKLNQLSEGLFKTILMFFVLYNSRDILVLLENPFCGLHPELFKKVTKELYEIAKTQNIQFFIITYDLMVLSRALGNGNDETFMCYWMSEKEILNIGWEDFDGLLAVDTDPLFLHLYR